jgi:peptide chain release factor 1
MAWVNDSYYRRERRGSTRLAVESRPGRRYPLIAMLERLKQVEERFEEAERQLADPAVASNPKELERLGKLRAELEPLVSVYREYKDATRQLTEARALVEDPEMREMAVDEVNRLRRIVDELEERLRVMLLPKDPNDERNVVIEIRAGVGGEEAALFARDLYVMYTRYAERKGWKSELAEYEEAEMGGASKITFNIEGRGAYSQLKHESGVHRVQRVPVTESSGRLHTSAASVVVMPEADEVEIEIKPEDISFETFRASTAGGQHMQKNDTAVRLTHKATRIVVQCQDERSQAQNKFKAMRVLRAKLYERELAARTERESASRKSAYRTGDRSEKIRTYNWPQSRVTDHRVGLTIGNLQGVMDGEIQPFCDALIADEQSKLLARDDRD